MSVAFLFSLAHVQGQTHVMQPRKKRSERKQVNIMKRDDLEKLGLTKEVIDSVMALHGADIETHKGKVTTAEATVATLQTQLTDANAQIEQFKGMNVDQIKAAADEWKTKFETAQTEAANQLAQVKFDHALESALNGAKAKNVKAVQALLSRDNLKLTDDGKILGLDEQLTKIKTDNDYLFEDARPTPKIVTGGKVQAGTVLSMEQIKTMSTADINKNWDAVQQTLAAQKGK
jgi:predicted phage tail protein